MPRRCHIGPTAGLLLWLTALPVFALEVTDDAGQRIWLEQPAQRILTLSPHATELVYAAGAGHRIAGAVNHSDYPEAAKALPGIGNATQLDRERILSLAPDLVIAWDSGNRQADLAWLEKRGIAVYRSEPRRLEQIATNIEQIGTLAGTSATADQAAAHFQQRLAALREHYQRGTPLTVFYQLWPQPLMTINGEHIISEVLRLCGGENIFPDLPALAAQVSREAVILANPQVIITSTHGGENQSLQQWRGWPTLQAVRDGHLYHVEADLIHRQTPRILDGATTICQDIAKAAAQREP
jgi:iron complex transport system substrate-binding protein